LLHTQQAAWNRGDLVAFMAGYLRSDELRFVSGDGVTLGFDATLARYQRGYPDEAAMGKLSFTDIVVWTLDHDHALATGRYQLERAADRPQGVFSLVLVRREGRLLIHLDHTTASLPDGDGELPTR
jgi:hypothetical protein